MRAEFNRASARTARARPVHREGWQGWDAYAAFYDWENARTVGRRDVRFWRAMVERLGGRVLELGCGTGRVSVQAARAAQVFAGIDRSAPMLDRGRLRLRRSRVFRPGVLVRGDIRALPYRRGAFRLVLAPYGIVQSLLSDGDVDATIADVAAVLEPGGVFGIDLVPDVPQWREYDRRVTLAGVRGPTGRPLALIESVRQDRRRKLTIFDQEFIEGRGPSRMSHRFTLTFRTLSIPEIARRLERAGFVVDAVLGSYRGSAWTERSEAWILLARRAR